MESTGISLFVESRRTCFLCYFLWVGLNFFWAAPLSAQTGGIAGCVLRDDAPAAGIVVTVAGSTVSGVTDSDGDYRILGMPVGEYTLQLSGEDLPAVEPVTVRVSVGITVWQNFTISTSGGSVVQALTAPLPPNETMNTTRHTRDDLLELPATVVADYLQLQTGVHYETSDQGQWLSMRGGDRFETDLLVDGISTMNVNIGRAWLGVNKTAIEEVVVETGGFTAQYGHVRSGLINVVTREGSRSGYTLDMETSYSIEGEKHFGRNLYDRNSPVYVTRAGRDNFIPGSFDNGSFTKDGHAKDWGTRGEVVIDYESPEYRGWFYRDEGFYTDDNWSIYSDNDIKRWGMEEVYSYPDRFEWDGWKRTAERWSNGMGVFYPADLLAEWMWQHPGIEYGNKPDYNLDVTLTGPVPGGSLPGFIGTALGRSTFMVSHRSQTSRFVYPTARRAFRDHNSQAKLTTKLTKSTTLRAHVLYGAAYGAQGYGNNGLTVYPPANNNSNPYYDDLLNGPQESISGTRNGSRLSGDFGRPVRELFNEGYNLHSSQYNLMTGAKLTHQLNTSTLFEMEYEFQRQTHNAEPMWPQDTYTDKFWIFNIDGLTNERGEPRTFVTDNANDIFPDGITQYFDPILADQNTHAYNDPSLVPLENINNREQVFSTGGERTWLYSRDLIEQWFDQNMGSRYDAAKGANRLWLAQGFDNEGNVVPYEEPGDLSGSWDLDHILNSRRLPDLYRPDQGGLLPGQTIPGVTLVNSQRSYEGWLTGDSIDRAQDFSLHGGGRQITKATSTVHGGNLRLVSQVHKQHRIAAGVDFRFYQVSDMYTHCNGRCYFNPGVPRDEDFWDVRGNWYARNWMQYHDNPFQWSAYLQDTIELRGLMVTAGLRADYLDPTTETIDFDTPYRSEFRNSGLNDPERGPSHYNTTTEKIPARARLKWSPRVSASLPLGNSSRLYTNYGWYYQAPTVDQFYAFVHWQSS
jgi:hypothetical protein